MKLLFLYIDGIVNCKTHRGGTLVACDRGGSAGSVVRATSGALGASAWREERGPQQQGRLRDGGGAIAAGGKRRHVRLRGSVCRTQLAHGAASARHQGVARSGVASVRLHTPPPTGFDRVKLSGCDRPRSLQVRDVAGHAHPHFGVRHSPPQCGHVVFHVLHALGGGNDACDCRM